MNATAIALLAVLIGLVTTLISVFAALSARRRQAGTREAVDPTDAEPAQAHRATPAAGPAHDGDGDGHGR